MSFPGVPGGAAGGGAVGMSDQEAAMVKAVSRSLQFTYDQDAADCPLMADARSNGKLPIQNCDLREYGLRSWRSFWIVHVQRMWRS